MYKFNYIIHEKLPKLSWCAVVERQSNVVTVHCGVNVECQKSFFVSGVWDGEFLKGEFDKARFFCGSGIKIKDNSIVCYTASHALEKLFVIQEETFIFVSNSAPFIMACSGKRLDNNVNQYERYFCSILDGYQKYKKHIPLAEGKELAQYFASDIYINEFFELEIKRRKAIPDFRNFQDYFSHLSEDLKKIVDNSTDSNRIHRFGIVSTISSGYDSCACATMTRKMGGDTVVSLSGEKYDDDDGASVAEQLGYTKIIKRDQGLYRNKTAGIDAEYVCSGELGTHLQFSVFEDVFANNLVLMGLRGDTYWGKKNYINNNFEMKDCFYYDANISYIENALRNGYIVIPLPAYGSSAAKSIRKITFSKEMQPWSLNNDYDRPIPRRIVESAGVNRESFGQIKHGGGFSFGYDNKFTIKNKMTEEGYGMFISFVEETKSERRSFKRILNKVKYTFKLLPTYFNVFCMKMKVKVRIKQKIIKMGNPGTPSDLIFWGMDNMKQRYLKALEEENLAELYETSVKNC